MKKAKVHIYQSTGRKLLSLAIAAAMVFIFMFASQPEANVYSWTDSDGVKHFSNSPPPSDENSSIDVAHEIAYDRAADEERWDLDRKAWEELTQNLEETESQIIQERYSEENTEESQSLADKIANEKFRLELEIARLEKMPATSFGYDMDGKRASIAFYRSRLKELETDPERYFNMK